MRKTILILSLIYAHLIIGQENFLNVYAQVKECRVKELATRDKRIKELKGMMQQHRSDTAYLRGIMRASRDSMNSSLLRQLRKVINVSFPDIIFSDKNNRHYSLSDFQGTDVAIVYNNMYCEPCLYLVDTTLNYVSKKNIKVIALFTIETKNQANVEMAYNENVIVGFIDGDTKELISLTMGDSFAYYLDNYGSVRFFDRLYFEKHESAWIDFLRSNPH